MGKKKHAFIFNPTPKIEFDDYNEYIRFRKKVDLALAKFGYTEHKEFLRDLYYLLESMVTEEEIREAKEKGVFYLLQKAKSNNIDKLEKARLIIKVMNLMEGDESE